MTANAHHRTTLSCLLGAPVHAPDGQSLGRVREAVVDTERSGAYVCCLIVSGRGGTAHSIRPEDLQPANSGGYRLGTAPPVEAWTPPVHSVMLSADVLDQQIIDVAGHKVVRVNDVDFMWETTVEGAGASLRIAEVEIGLRGAARRLLKGLPEQAVTSIAQRFTPRVIPWEFVDLIDRDPARRVRLKIAGDRLSHMHPSDIADILEELAPAERDAVFTSLDEQVAAEALEEVEPRLQRSLIENLESSRIADIIEEMDPAAAADLLNELPEARSDEILNQMEADERHDVEELLHVDEDTAAASMTTEFVAVAEDATVEQAMEALRSFEGDLGTLTEIYLLSGDKLAGVVNLSRLLLSTAQTPLVEIRERRARSCERDSRTSLVAELFDKYNLRSLPVVVPETEQEHQQHTGRLVGVIHAEHVISLLRKKR